MKRYFNVGRTQALLCIVMFGVAFAAWYFTRSGLISMLACVGFTALWIGIGLLTYRPKKRGPAGRQRSRRESKRNSALS